MAYGSLGTYYARGPCTLAAGPELARRWRVGQGRDFTERGRAAGIYHKARIMSHLRAFLR